MRSILFGVQSRLFGLFSYIIHGIDTMRKKRDSNIDSAVHQHWQWCHYVELTLVADPVTSTRVKVSCPLKITVRSRTRHREQDQKEPNSCLGDPSVTMPDRRSLRTIAVRHWSVQLERTKVHTIDGSTQGKRDDEYLEFASIKDFDGVRSAARVFSCVGSSPVRSRSIPSVRSAPSQRRETEYGTVDIPRSHILVVATHAAWLAAPPRTRGWEHKKTRSDSVGHMWRDELQQRLRETEVTAERRRCGFV